jgi:hypothetical protein
MLSFDAVHAFGVVRRVTSDVYQMTTTHLSEIAEPVGGDMHENEVDSSFDGADENDETLGEIDNPFVSLQNFSISEDVSPMSPPLTYQKFLTMQASACCSNCISMLQQLLAVENISRKIKVPHMSLSFLCATEQASSGGYSVFSRFGYEALLFDSGQKIERQPP